MIKEGMTAGQEVRLRKIAELTGNSLIRMRLVYASIRDIYPITTVAIHLHAAVT